MMATALEGDPDIAYAPGPGQASLRTLIAPLVFLIGSTPALARHRVVAGK